MTTRPALVIQCFIKTDTVQALCDSLLRCTSRDRFDLIFWCDSALGSRKEAEYAPLNAAVVAQLTAFRAQHGAQFASCQILGNDMNRGCYETCQAALDFAFADHDFAVFAEDDTIFSRDALDWFLACRDSEAFGSDRVWAITGESIFFDARGETVERDFVDRARAFAERRALHDKFVEFAFLPSTCFATSAAKWAEFGETRGQSIGDELVCARCAAEGKTGMFPALARVKDTGMLHDLGLSVATHSAANVREIKNTYLMAEDVHSDLSSQAPLLLPEEERGEIFRRATKLEGFDDVAQTPSSDRNGQATEPESLRDADNPPPSARPPILPRTLSLIADIPPGTFVPEETKVYDEDEIRELGSLLCRLIYAPSQIRKKIESYGASIVPADFYSEIPSQLDIEAAYATPDTGPYDAIFQDKDLLVETLRDMTRYSAEFDPPVEPPSAGDFGWRNDYFSYSDAMASYAMLRRVKPKTVIEIGCGWSTLVADQALQRNGSGRILCLEPYPSPMLDTVRSVEALHKTSVQSVDLAFFKDNLEDGDVLFIDSTHTIKAGSDCLRIYLEILPSIRKNIVVHVHDVKLPYMFSHETLRDKQIYWTEQYLLYAYLLRNPSVRTLYGSNYHLHANRDLLKAFMHGRYPEGGGSLWFCQSAAEAGNGRKSINQAESFFC